MSAIVIRNQSDGSEVHRIDVTDKTDREIEKIERGLARNFDFDTYTYGEEN